MPEGDTIRQYATALAPMLTGQVAHTVECRWPRVVQGLSGCTITTLETRGKHLLVHFDDASALRVHLGMKGSWHRYDPGERWQKSRGDLGVAFHTDEDVVICFFAKEVERLRGDQRLLPHLGPDLLGPADLSEVVARTRRSPHTELQAVLVDQTLAAGLGNVYRCEALFIEQVYPWAHPDSLDDAQLEALWATGERLLKANADTPDRNTTGQDAPPLHVYDRSGRPCLRCDTPIAFHHGHPELGRRSHRERMTWWCPTCQAP